MRTINNGRLVITKDQKIKKKTFREEWNEVRIMFYKLGATVDLSKIAITEKSPATVEE